MTEKSRSISVFIDADNINCFEAELALFKLSHQGRLKLIRAFGNFAARPKVWGDLCRRYVIETEHRYNIARSKNASDISLVVDATAHCCHTKSIDTNDSIAIVSSDSDFIPLVQHAKSLGFRVIGLGCHKAPRSYRELCDEWILLDGVEDIAA